MIADLVLPLTGTSGDENALVTAIALAEHMNAHLCVVESLVYPTPMMNPWGLMPDMAAESIYGQLKEEAESNASKLRKRLEREAISWEVRIAESFFADPPRSMAMHAHYADLSIVNAVPLETEGGPEIRGGFINALLFETGRPVLVIPPHFSMVFPISRAIIAWQPTREAARALHDALPLLRKAKTVDVLMVDPVVGENEHGERPGADIAVHLARHGIHVNVVVRPGEKRTTAEALLHYASMSGAELLVAGAYGHSRLREWTIGGTTRELLQLIRMPILFSH